VALIGCPSEKLRSVMQEAVDGRGGLAPLGGRRPVGAGRTEQLRILPCFDFGSLTEKTVDSWIALAEELGVTQIDFHGGRSFRFGDFAPPRISIPTAWRA